MVIDFQKYDTIYSTPTVFSQSYYYAISNILTYNISKLSLPFVFHFSDVLHTTLVPALAVFRTFGQI